MRKLFAKRSWIIGALAAAAVVVAGAARSAETAVPVVPAPAHVSPAPGSLRISDGMAVRVRANDPQGRRTAAWFIDLAGRTRGVELRLADKASPPPAIVFQLAYPEAFQPDAYRLEITPKGALITASTDAGLMYGAGTLWQLITADGVRTGPATVRAMTIEDQPRFQWRGLMLDSVRHYQSPAYIRRLIDVMALHKLNVLHWHLTDDQGWRLEIRKYPRLTGVGAGRVPAGAGAAADIDPATGRPRLYGGFYSQAEVKALVAYAQARHVTIVPEIEMPGHALAAVVAYPKLGVVGAPAAVSSDWGVFPYLYNADDDTFGFLEDVLDEVMELFPSRFIHIGGDEAVKDQWKASPKIQARLRELGLKDEAALQGYFTARIAKYLADHGRRAIGWDEILEGGLPEGAAVMSWRGVEGAEKAAREGYDTVLAAWPTLYFDNRQSPSADEPPGRGRIVTLKDVYAFNATPAGTPPEETRHILGLQANVWTEHIRTEDRVDHMTWPREAAVAEIGWSPAETHDWPGFLGRMKQWRLRYAALNVHFSDAAFTELEPPKGGTRLSQELTTCSDKLTLSLEDDAPLPGGIHGEHAIFLIDVMDPCWRWEGADLTGVTAITVVVGQVPFNFQLGADRDKIKLARPRTPEGELEVRLDRCDGDPVAVLPLKPAVANPTVTTLAAPLPATTGRHDLCFNFTAKSLDPMWAIDRIELQRAVR
jgi:hexosaminidase